MFDTILHTIDTAVVESARPCSGRNSASDTINNNIRNLFFIIKIFAVIDTARYSNQEQTRFIEEKPNMLKMVELKYMVFLVIFVYVQTSEAAPADEKTSIDESIAQIFGADSANTQMSITQQTPQENIENTCQYTCVPYYRCNTTSSTEGDGIIDIRERRDVNECSHYIDVCCKPENIIPVDKFTK